jgi:hypothetical protein
VEDVRQGKKAWKVEEMYGTWRGHGEDGRCKAEGDGMEKLVEMSSGWRGLEKMVDVWKGRRLGEAIGGQAWGRVESSQL